MAFYPHQRNRIIPAIFQQARGDPGAAILWSGTFPQFKRSEHSDFAFIDRHSSH